jgi:hypothetical protein
LALPTSPCHRRNLVFDSQPAKVVEKLAPVVATMAPAAGLPDNVPMLRPVAVAASAVVDHLAQID